jgi:integrase
MTDRASRPIPRLTLCFSLCYCDAVKHYRTRFRPVFDGRKRKVRGLWQRGDKYYVQLRVDLGNGRTAPRRIPLQAANLEEAKACIEKKRTQRREGLLAATGFRPKFSDFSAQYLQSPLLAQKKVGTQQNERQAITRWNAYLGGIRIDKIAPPIINGFREKRLADGCTARTVNLDVVALRNVLKLARDRGLIDRLPEIKQLKQRPPVRRPLLSKDQFQALCAAADDVAIKNGQLFKFYLRFLALTGAREQEALSVAWHDVDFANQVATIGNEGASKNHKSRVIDFSLELEALLLEMVQARPPDSIWLFPSPQRGGQDKQAKSLRETLCLVRKMAGLPGIGFHDLRHFFTSQCVMAGIDFMTIAAWLGHSDGGLLVGKVYGHLADSHKKAAAKKLVFFERRPND